jgi:predicted dehydrogenase
MKKIQVGIIGTGTMGRHHVRIFSKLENTEVIGVFDTDTGKLNSVCQEHSVPAVSSIEELIDKKPNAVSIAIPASAHSDVAVKFLQKRIPVLIEKPIADTMESAKKIIDASKKFDTPAMVGHIERFNPAVYALKKYLTNKKILSIDITRVGPTPPRIKDVGITIDLGIHDIDLVSFLTGEKIISSTGAIRSTKGDKYEDISMLLLKLSDGCIAQIHSNWLTPVKTRAIQIATTTEFIKVDLIAKTVDIFNRFPDNDDASFSTSLPVEQKEPLKSEIEAFVDALRIGKPFPVTALEGYDALLTAYNCLTNSI